MLAQICLPLKFEAEENSTGLTAWAGLPVFLELMATVGLPSELMDKVGLRPDQGWSDIQQVAALVLLKLAGGDCVTDVDQLEADDGLCAIVEALETHHLREGTRHKIEGRMRRGGERTFPSPTAIREYLEAFEPDEQTTKAAGDEGASLPEPSPPLEGLREVVARPVHYGELRSHQATEATLDIDATLAQTANRSAKPCYEGYPAYQPVNVFWFEVEQVLFSEFRDGNCPAAWRIDEIVEEGLARLPDFVDTARVRSDTAGYNIELIRSMADGDHPRFGEIEFAIGVPVEQAFKASCLACKESRWEPLAPEGDDEIRSDGRLEYAEIPHLPQWLAHTQKDFGIRFLAVREPLGQKSLPVLEAEDDPQEELPFPTMEFEADGYKITGIVTNCEATNAETIAWYFERCGLSEQAHGECKVDLGGMPFPSADDFQANAAWWQITLLAFNLAKLLQRDFWRTRTGPLRRMKRLRFQLICVPGRVVCHARQMTVKIPEDHPALSRIREVRDLMGMLQRGPPTPWLKPAA